MNGAVKAVLVKDLDDARNTPGAIEIRQYSNGEFAGMAFICPCGCGQEGYLPFEPAPSPSWAWDGNLLKPTLAPSILQKNGCRWHGWLKAGEFVTC